MAKEIKFRGKCITEGYEGQWAYGHYLTRRQEDGLHHMISTQDMWGFHEVDPETVGQYTGKKDEEGTEIYDRDHLWAPGNLDDDLQPVGMVVWDDEDARWEVFSINGRFEWIPDGCVVRNEHPHLLEQGEKTDV